MMARSSAAKHAALAAMLAARTVRYATIPSWGGFLVIVGGIDNHVEY
jgi:hypothetical protein